MPFVHVCKTGTKGESNKRNTTMPESSRHEDPTMMLWFLLLMN